MTLTDFKSKYNLVGSLLENITINKEPDSIILEIDFCYWQQADFIDGDKETGIVELHFSECSQCDISNHRINSDEIVKNDDKKSTQLVFCDFSTPKNDGSFNLYDDIRDKLIAKGVPKEEIAFIHEADSEAKKKELFSKVRQGKVRVLLGSTAKCGAGTNIQDKLIALHHLDCPWRPSDLEQREGRIIRQGNENKEVEVYRYMTEATFDAYLYQTIENKQRFISQIMSSKSPVRSCEDVDEATLSYAEVKALCAGNPLIKEKMDLDVAVTKLKVSKANHTSQQYSIEDSVRKHFPERIAKTEQRIEGYKSDLAHVKAQPIVTEGIAPMTVLNKTFTDKEEAGKAILLACKQVKSKESLEIGSYKGFDMSLSYDSFAQEFHLELQREMSYTVTLGTFRVLCDYLHLLKDWRTEYAPKSAEEQPNPLFVKALTEIDYIDSLLDCFISGSKDDVADIVKDENGSIAKIEKTVRQSSKTSAELTM